MRCMAELHMSFQRKTVYPLPRNLQVLISIFNDFLYFRFFPRQLCMTQHAFTNGWNPGFSARIRAHMTVETIQSQLYVGIVWKCDWLLRQPCNPEQRYEP